MTTDSKTWPSFDFDAMNESDVREEIVSPLLRLLGYRSGTANNVLREQTLSYPCLPLGRQKASDPAVRGRADYICEAAGAVRWTIEAKPPSESLDEATQSQAWTYSNHPEVRAVYFCLCNGRQFQIYRTVNGPTAAPIFACEYDELPLKQTTISNILSPDTLLRDYPPTVIDTGIPLARGLRSWATVTGGRVIVDTTRPSIRHLVGMLMTVSDGAISRTAEGMLQADLTAVVPQQSLQALNEKLGLHQMQLLSVDDVLSTDLNRPTIFQSVRSVCLHRGQTILDMASWREVDLPADIAAKVRTTATGALDTSNKEFVGRFVASFQLQFQGSLEVAMEGDFRIQLA